MVVHEQGRVGAPVVVLVHGIGTSGRYLRPLAADLARDHLVLVPDLPGFGASPRPPRAPSVEELAQLVLRELDRRDVRPVVLVGHSMGAQVVAAAMRGAPGASPAGVLIGPVTEPRAATATRHALRLVRSVPYEPLAANVVVAVDYLRAGPRWYARMLAPMLTFDTAGAVADVRGRVLVVRGRHDRVANRGWARELATRAPHGELREVPAAGHLAMARAPGLVARWVRELAADVR